MACAAALTDAVTAYAPDTCSSYLNTPAERMLQRAVEAMHAQHISMRRIRQQTSAYGSKHAQHKQAIPVTCYAPDTSTHLPACMEVGLSQGLEHECMHVRGHKVQTSAWGLNFAATSV